jgi:rhodanese-related sulfurtransferase
MWRFASVLCAVALLAASAALAQPIPPIPIVFIKVAEVHALMTRGTPPVLVDVRSREEYEARHIKGALSIPLNEVAGRASELPRYPLVVLY